MVQYNTTMTETGAKHTTVLENILNDFNGVIKKPQVFLSNCEENFVHQIKNNLKHTYDFTKTVDLGAVKSKSEALPELIVQSFDLEQIWQQIELQNDPVLTQSIVDVSKFVVSKNNLLFFDANETIADEQNGDDGNESEDLVESSERKDDENSSSSDLSDELQQQNGDISDSDASDGDVNDVIKPNSKKTSVVDDEFFKLNEMENFLIAEEKKLNQTNKSGTKSESESDSDEEDSIDLFEAEDENDDTIVNPKYKDFFGAGNETTKKVKRNKFFETQSDSENERSDDENVLRSDVEEDAPKSSFELRQERLQKKIEQIESAAVSEKPWQLKGEITAEGRPQNSLLEEIVEFDITTRPPPVITEETTYRLEDIIRQRIKDKAFDSVERKIKPVETPLEYKKKLVLDQEKSKESLAQIYEKEYLKQKEALDPEAAEREEEEPQLHKEIKTMMSSLFAKLDALSNFHFTPKPVAPELKIVSNLPAVNMEEVAPVSASDATLLAPEEVKARIKGDVVIGKSERTDTDKKRERRKKKKKQKVHVNERLKKDVTKMKLGLGNKYSKEKAKHMLDQVMKDKNIDKMDESAGSKPVKSSTAFFTQLQEEVTKQIQAKSQMKRKKGNGTLSAKRIKL